MRPDFRFLSGPVLTTSGGLMPGLISDRLFFLSGVVATGDGGHIVGIGDMGRQADQAFANLRTFLAAAGCEPADVVRLVVYTCDAAVFHVAVAPAMAAFLGEHKPALTAIGVARLISPDALIEVEATAVLPPPLPQPRR